MKIDQLLELSKITRWGMHYKIRDIFSVHAKIRVYGKEKIMIQKRVLMSEVCVCECVYVHVCVICPRV